MAEAHELNPDFRDLLTALSREGVDFLVVGAHALAFHGVVRSTGDLDVLVRPTPDNAERVVRALQQFGAPLAAHGVGQADFERSGTVYQLGLPPSRIDLLTQITGVEYEEASRDAEGAGARDEWRLLGQELLALIERTDIPTPATDTLYRELDLARTRATHNPPPRAPAEMAG